MKKLSEKKKELLRDFVSRTCEQCHKKEKEVGNLTPHRINRGYLGGKYVLRNIIMLCHACHTMRHYKEFH